METRYTGEQFKSRIGRPAIALATFVQHWPITVLLVIALIVRSPLYGDPDVHLDEQFYLLVGDRMWQGALPYVDIWDRKPIGLFLIYAAARMLGGDGVIQYQVLAALFAGATAGVIWIMACRHASKLGAFLSSLCYLFWLNIFGGSAGQSPVFYNLFVAIAALLAMRSNDTCDPHRITRLGVVAMVVCGLSLQIKYTAVIESTYLGTWFLWRLWQVTRNIWRIILTGLAWALLGTAATTLVAVFYAVSGYSHEFFFANFISIFNRGYLGNEFMQRAFQFYFLIPLPLTLCIPLGLFLRWQQRHQGGTKDLALLTGWLIAAFGGFIMIGNFYDHYALPLLTPTFVAIAPLFCRQPVGKALATILVGYVLFLRIPDFSYVQKKREKIEQLTKAVTPYVKNHCLFIFDGPSIIYLKTRACMATRFAYSDHLINSVEDGAIGTDTVKELRRILDSRPGAIITAEAPVIPEMNMRTLSLLRERLPKEYDLIAAVDHPDRTYYVYALRTLTHGTGVRGPVPYDQYETAALPH